MKKIALLLFFTGVAVCLAAQTRRIAHRSHGGGMHSSYGWEGSTYGNPVIDLRVRIRLDSLHDTLVDPWDSLALKMYIEFPNPRLNNHEAVPPQNIREMGRGTGRIVTRF